MTKCIEIGGRRVGPGNLTYCVAEVSGNHNQDFSQAVRIIEAAKHAGADAIKLQTYTPDTITIASDQEPFRISGGTLWDGRNFARSLQRSLHAMGVAAETQEGSRGSGNGFVFERFRFDGSGLSRGDGRACP